MLTWADMRKILDDCAFNGEEFVLSRSDAPGSPYLQLRYVERDVDTGLPSPQYGRKWQLSVHMTKSEIVQTAFKAVMTSMEHRAREHFLYRGERVFGPHFDVDALHELARTARLDVRPSKEG